MFPYQFVTGREVEDDVCTREGEIIAGWNRRPYILADFHAKLHAIGRNEELGLCTH